MADCGLIEPANQIVVTGDPLVVVKRVVTATNVAPGRLVKYSTDDSGIVVLAAATDNPLGWVGYEQAGNYYTDGHAITTAYTANDMVPILFGGHFVIKARTATNLTCGDTLIGAANGLVALAVAIDVVVTAGSTTVLGSAAGSAACTESGSKPPGGQVVGVAMETVLGGTTEDFVMVLSYI